jgi:hypothetical protein
MQLRRMPRSFALVVRLTPPPLSPVARTRLQAPARRAPRARPSLRLAVSALVPMPSATRDYGVAAPGDLVQVDTLDVRPRPGVTFKQFTAREVVSHWDRMETYRRTTSVPATHFLTTLQRRMPVPFGPFKSLGAVSSPPPLNRPASSRAFASSSSRRARETQRGCGTREPHAHGIIL